MLDLVCVVLVNLLRAGVFGRLFVSFLLGLDALSNNRRIKFNKRVTEKGVHLVLVLALEFKLISRLRVHLHLMITSTGMSISWQLEERTNSSPHPPTNHVSHSKVPMTSLF